MEIFHDSSSRYGYRRITLELRNQGVVANHKLIYKLMRQLGLKSKVRRRKYNSYKGSVSHIADNLLDRQFTPDSPNKVWVSDVTEFRIAGRKVYLSPIMDLYDRTILAHTMSNSPTTEFTASSLKEAIEMFAPNEQLMVHTDQGIQYQHKSWRNLIAQVGGVQSMSRKGNCYDNAVMENFFGHLKTEMYHGEHFTSVKQFRKAVDDYILWYNTKRLQAQFKGLTPMHYRNQTLEKALAI